MNDNTENQQTTLRDKVLATIPEEAHVAFLRLALDAGIHNPDDAAWGDVALAYTASVSAAAAGEAAAAVRSGIEKIPDAIRSSTIAAGNDLAATVAASGKKIMDESEQRAADVTAKTEAAIKAATTAGSGALRAAMAGLEKAAQARQAQIVETWQTALGRAAEKEAKATLIRVAGWRWTQIAGALLCAMMLGAGLLCAGLVESGKVLPWGWELNPIPTAPCSLTQVARPGVGVGECAAVRG